MKKLILICLFLSPSLAWSIEDAKLDEEIQRRQIEQNINQIGQEISKNIQDAGKQLQTIIPAMTSNLSDIINTFTTEMIPVIQAIEENSRLMEASDSMAEALKQSLPPQYRQEIQYSIDSPNNELKISGKIIENKTTTNFTIIRNLTAATITQGIMTEANKVEEANFHTPNTASLPNGILAGVEDEKIPLKDFKLELIKDNAFMVNEDSKQQKTLIFGNLNPVLVLQAKSSGPEHAAKIREFITNLDLPEINQAISYEPSENQQ